MTRRLGLWICLLLGAGCVRIDVPPPSVAAPAVAASAIRNVQVDLACVLPAAGPAVANGVLVARLYAYDLRQADAQAREIGRATLPGVFHRPGAKTVLHVSCAGQTVGRQAHYLTAVVYPEGAPAGRSGLYFIDGFQRVLVGRDRESLRVALAPVPEEGGPTN